MAKVKVRLSLVVEEKDKGIHSDTRFFFKDVQLARVPVAGDHIYFAKDYDPLEVDHVVLFSNPAFGFFGRTADVEVWFRKDASWWWHVEASENVSALDKVVIGEWKWKERK